MVKTMHMKCCVNVLLYKGTKLASYQLAGFRYVLHAHTRTRTHAQQAMSTYTTDV